MRRILLFAVLMLLSACRQPLMRSTGDTPALDTARLAQEIKPIAAAAAPGVLGFAIMNLGSGESWTFNGERRFPLDDIATLPIGAAAIGEMEGGRLSGDEALRIREVDLSPPPSAIAEAWPRKTDFKADALLAAAVGGSDTTADDVLIHRVGGPGAVTAWLVDKHVPEVRLDRYRREIDPTRSGLGSFRSRWKDEAAYAAAQAGVAPEARRAAMSAYLADPRDTATPRGMIRFLQAVTAGELISNAGSARLMGTMAHDVPPGLPAGARYAHRRTAMRAPAGAAGIDNDVGVLTLKDGRRYAVAVFLAGAVSPHDHRAATLDQALAAAGRSVR